MDAGSQTGMWQMFIVCTNENFRVMVVMLQKMKMLINKLLACLPLSLYVCVCVHVKNTLFSLSILLINTMIYNTKRVCPCKFFPERFLKFYFLEFLH